MMRSSFDHAQCRMARAGLRLKISDLAIAAGVATQTIVNFEKGLTGRSSSAKAIQMALELAGAEFVASANGDTRGVLIPDDKKNASEPR